MVDDVPLVFTSYTPRRQKGWTRYAAGRPRRNGQNSNRGVPWFSMGEFRAQAIGVLRVFVEPVIAQQVIAAVFCPDIGLDGDGELFVLGICCAGGYGGQLGIPIGPKSHITRERGYRFRRKGVTNGRQAGKSWFYDQGVIYFFFRRVSWPKYFPDDIGYIHLLHSGGRDGRIPGCAVAGRSGIEDILYLSI